VSRADPSASESTPDRGLPPERLARIGELEGWHFWFAGRRVLVERLLERSVPPGEPVLDVGCGTGSMVRSLGERGYRVAGLDLVLPRLHVSGDGRLPAARLMQGSATAVPVRDASVSGVLLLDVLEHVDDRAALLEVSRVLRPGGAAVITVPAMPFLWSHRDVAAGHLRRYTRASLVRAVREAGLRLEELRFYQFLLFPLVLASRLLGRRPESEEHPPPRLNRALSAVARAEARWGDRVRWPWGSSLVAVARKPRREGAPVQVRTANE
jgi:SAM-dependent methyltransferase